MSLALVTPEICAFKQTEKVEIPLYMSSFNVSRVLTITTMLQKLFNLAFLFEQRKLLLIAWNARPSRMGQSPDQAGPTRHSPLMASVGVAASRPLSLSLSLSRSNHFDDVKSGFYSWPKRGKVLGLKSLQTLGRIRAWIVYLDYLE